MEQIDNMTGGSRGYYGRDILNGIASEHIYSENRYSERRKNNRGGHSETRYSENRNIGRGGHSETRYSDSRYYGGMEDDVDGQISRKCMALIENEIRKDPELGHENAIQSVIQFHIPHGSDNCTWNRPNLHSAVRRKYDFDTNTLKRGGYRNSYYLDRDFYPDSMHGGALGEFRNEIGIISLRDEILNINLD